MKSNILWWANRAACGRPVATFARLSLVVFFMCSLLAVSASAAPNVYVVTLSQQFGTVDLATGQFTPIGSPTPDGMSNLVWWNGSLISLATTGANAGYLVKIDPATGGETVLRAITYNRQPLGFNAFDLAKVGGALYVTDFSNNLYAVDFATGAARPVGHSGGTTGLRPDPNIPFTFNSDGTFNLCDEGLYGFDGKLYASFDSFAIDPNHTPPTRAHEYMSPYVWQIDPRTGAATFAANTDWQVSAIVGSDGQFYAFEAVFDSFDFNYNVPIGHAELVKLDLRTGKTSKVADIVPNPGPIFGAAPIR
ncbi:MAG TPA: hypothetical protein VMH04_10460 [Candidatus Solibacter sp.]|nr:hypothetical protein [Candidatus Solibacter sp.]